MEYKHEETKCMSKSVVGADMASKGIMPEIFKVCFQELNKHYFLNNSAHLQKAYLCNHIKNPNM
eukprot:3369825-Ditylum_brightwellii.AAC.1